ncbi:hypothetical protein ACIRRA_05555 [Nocardia sp. NPDC101769]|uniref:hypothetical protein n=1 Tax=Nocardia sp. NPDC101769 TaxID=3364333 RepID=UPI0038199354
MTGEVAWMPTDESGVQVYLSLSEAEELADALTAALIEHNRLLDGDDGEGSEPDWEPGQPPEPKYDHGANWAAIAVDFDLSTNQVKQLARTLPAGL